MQCHVLPQAGSRSSLWERPGVPSRDMHMILGRVNCSVTRRSRWKSLRDLPLSSSQTKLGEIAMNGQQTTNTLQPMCCNSIARGHVIRTVTWLHCALPRTTSQGGEFGLKPSLCSTYQACPLAWGCVHLAEVGAYFRFSERCCIY